MQRHVAGGEHTEVAVQGHDPFVWLKRHGGTYCYGFLANTTEPFGDPSLAQQHQHFFFDQPWPQQLLVEMKQIFVGKSLAMKVHEFVLRLIPVANKAVEDIAYNGYNKANEQG